MSAVPVHRDAGSHWYWAQLWSVPCLAPQDEGGAGSFASLFRQFGAVTVSGRNLYDLMAGDEVALLYPGVVQGHRQQCAACCGCDVGDLNLPPHTVQPAPNSVLQGPKG